MNDQKLMSITFPFILVVDDYHEFSHIKNLLHKLGIDCRYQELGNLPYGAVFYVGDEYPEKLNEIRLIKL